MLHLLIAADDVACEIRTSRAHIERRVRLGCYEHEMRDGQAYLSAEVAFAVADDVARWRADLVRRFRDAVERSGHGALLVAEPS